MAMVVLGVAIVGTLSLLLAVQSHNQSADDSRTAHKACQEVMEQLLSMPWDAMMIQDGIQFQAINIHPTELLGSVEINNIGGPGNPEELAEIVVRIQTDTASIRPINVSLVMWRANQ